MVDNSRLKRHKILLIISSALLLHLLLFILLFSQLTETPLIKHLQNCKLFKKLWPQLPKNSRPALHAAAHIMTDQPVIFWPETAPPVKVPSPAQKKLATQTPQLPPNQDQNKTAVAKPDITNDATDITPQTSINRENTAIETKKSIATVPVTAAAKSENHADHQTVLTKFLDQPARTTMLTLPELAPGSFMRFWDANGRDVMSQTGNKNINPSLANLKELSYEAAVRRTFEAAFNAYKTLYNIHVPTNAVLYVQFTLNLAGQVTDLTIQPLNVSLELRQLIAQVIQYASPFPAIPKHLARDSYTLEPFTINFSSGPLRGHYGWQAHNF